MTSLITGERTRQFGSCINNNIQATATIENIMRHRANSPTCLLKKRSEPGRENVMPICLVILSYELGTTSDGPTVRIPFFGESMTRMPDLVEKDQICLCFDHGTTGDGPRPSSRAHHGQILEHLET